MLSQTAIEWTHYTVNFWEGCQKVGPGCDNCYAEARDVRFTGGSHWGPNAPRRLVKGGIAKLRKINRDAPNFHEEHGHWPRVFCSSLSDVFDNAVQLNWRVDAFIEMDRATDTRIQLLTKRVGNVEKLAPDMWLNGGWPSHVGLMITVVNQTEADRDIPKLLDLKARLGIPWVGISYEPALGPIRLDRIRSPESWGENPDGWTFDCMTAGDYYTLDDGGPPLSSDGPWREAAIDWVICGGESGPNARPMHPDWARSVRDQCEAAGVPYLFKQWGEWHPMGQCLSDGNINAMDKGQKQSSWDETTQSVHVGKKRAGRLLDGREWNGFPVALT